MKKSNDLSVIVKMRATDFYGSCWEICSYAVTDHEGDGDEDDDDDDDAEEESKTVLFRWESGMFNSLVPPKFGWERVDDDGNSVEESDLYLHYSFDTGRGW